MSETGIIRRLRSNGSVLFLVTTFALYHKQKQHGYLRLCQSRLNMSKGHYSSLSSLFSDKQIRNRKTWHRVIISMERVNLTLSPSFPCFLLHSRNLVVNLLQNIQFLQSHYLFYSFFLKKQSF